MTNTALRRVAFPSEGNPLYPLPPDYLDLTTGGQRQARVNASRQWLVLHPNRADRGLAMAKAIDFFDTYYLWPDHEADFNPLFYSNDPVESPIGMLNAYRMWGASIRSVYVAPRGYIKTHGVLKRVLNHLVSQQGFGVTYATSTDDNATSAASKVKSQIVENERINDDFSPETPNGRLIPKKGDRPFGVEMMTLDNGSWLRPMSVNTRSRGNRPDLFVLDDPEYDARASTSVSLLRAYMERLIFKIVLPMLTRPGCSVVWLATFVSRRHYAWHAMETETLADGTVTAKDRRFNGWSRLVIPAEYTDADGIRRSAWPAMWPLTVADKEADPALAEYQSLEEIRESIGKPHYDSEYLARPGSNDSQYLGSLDDEQHGWSLVGVDEHAARSPLSSMTKVKWHRPEKKGVMEMPMSLFLRERVSIFMCVDSSYTSGPDSDYKACVLMGWDHVDDILFVLDAWAAQCREDLLVNEIFRMADQWGCTSVHIETVRETFSLFTRVERMAIQRIGTNLPYIRVAQLKTGQVRKVDRIDATKWRFDSGLIKFPLASNARSFHMLFDQIEGFHPDADDGGLEKDDLIDCVAYSNHVIRGRGHRAAQTVEVEHQPIELLLKGQTTHDGLNVADSLDFNSTPAIDLLRVMETVNRGSTNHAETRC